MNKEKYEIPITEIIAFETEDIITTSGGFGDVEGDVDLLTGFINF